jgi:DNA primase
MLQHPAWIARLPVDLVPLDDEEGRALAALVDAMSVGDIEPNWGLGALVERFRDSPHASILSNTAAELVGTDYDESIIETLLEDSIRKLHADAINREIVRLTQQERDQGLTHAERRRLAELLIERRNLSSKPKD